MKDFGKKFEVDFNNSCERVGKLSYRIKTRQTKFVGDNEIADFILYDYPLIYFLELKSTKEKRLPFSMIRANQLVGLRDIIRFKGVGAGVVVQFREPTYSHYYVPITVIEEAIIDGKKSLSIKHMQEDDRIIYIPHTQKRVTVELDIETLLNKLGGI